VREGLVTKADLLAAEERLGGRLAALEERIDARMIRYMVVQAVGILTLNAAITAAIVGGIMSAMGARP
jgi:hypothetical protein